MSKEIKTSHFKTIEELLEHLKMWERDGDYEAYCRFFDYECAYEMAHYIDKLQKENEELKGQRDNAIKLRNELIEEQKITCISKNKIRNKIKELDNEIGIGFELDKDETNGARVVLKELLGE